MGGLPDLPIKLGPCSNGEYVPRPVSPVVQEAVRRASEEADRTARRLGMSRRRFLTTVCGSAVTLLAVGACSDEAGRSSGDGSVGGTFDLPPESTTEPDAAGEVLRGDEFIMDVQGHLLEYDLNPATAGQPFFGDGFPQADCGEDDPRACFSISHFMEEVFLRSDTSFVVLSALPIPGDANPLSIEVMEETRRVAEGLCRDDRMRLHGQAMPNLGSPEAALAAMDAAVAAHDVAAWKVYTHLPAAQGFFLDDRDPDAPQVGDAFVRKVAASGVPIICVHKGLRGVGSGSAQYASPEDIGPAAAAHPDVSFVVYHSGYEIDATEGPYEGPTSATAQVGVNRLLKSLDDAGVEPGANVYAELGSTWRSVMGSPTEAAHLLGKLLKRLGDDRVVWGTDSIWYGSPQDQIQAFRAFQITPEFQERHGYPELTDERKAKILGLNSAALYGVDPVTVPCPFTRADLEEVRTTLSLPRTYGPETRAQVAGLLAAHGAFV